MSADLPVDNQRVTVTKKNLKIQSEESTSFWKADLGKATNTDKEGHPVLSEFLMGAPFALLPVKHNPWFLPQIGVPSCAVCRTATRMPRLGLPQLLRLFPLCEVTKRDKIPVIFIFCVRVFIMLSSI